MKESNQRIAGLSLRGGKKENFFLVLLEYFPDENRWFLSSLNQLRDHDIEDRDQVINKWIGEYEFNKLVVDFPLSKATCDTCQLDCPGTAKCEHPHVTKVRSIMKSLLERDDVMMSLNPKKYEQDRVESEMVHYSEDILAKQPCDDILSKSFKRKLKKGFLPYWNRPLDVWIWLNYYDHLLKIFKNSYDSFGNVSTMLMARFKYLQRHFPGNVQFFESHTHICLLELMRAGVILKNQILDLNSIDEAPIARLKIVKEVEKKLKVFIYEHDVEEIVKNPKAFESFLLALVGRCHLMDSVHKLAEWSIPNSCQFLSPIFVNN